MGEMASEVELIKGYRGRRQASDWQAQSTEKGTRMVRMFRVVVDPPIGGTFLSGSEVRGKLIVETEEDKIFKYIHISLTGRAQVRYAHARN